MIQIFPTDRLASMRQIAQGLRDMLEMDINIAEQALENTEREWMEQRVRGTEEARAYEEIGRTDQHIRFPALRLSNMRRLLADLQQAELDTVRAGDTIASIQEQYRQGIVEGDQVVAEEVEAAEQERLRLEIETGMATGLGFMS